MKDIIITKKRIFLEALFLILCFVLAEGLNVHAIKKFNTSWDELWTQWLTILVLTALFYGFFTVMRIAIKLIIIIFKVLTRKSGPASIQT
jgi:hypothetical protein